MFQDSKQELQNLLPKDGKVFYFPHFFKEQERMKFYNLLVKKTDWQQQKIKLFGKTHNVPRLTALYGDDNKSYTYSGITMKPIAWLPELLTIKNKIETLIETEFTTVLLNLYRTGHDSMGWHSDDEMELGINPIIASVSFGATRIFNLQHKEDKNLKISQKLTDGSLLIMQGQTQHYWRHSVPKTLKNAKPRTNLTFRKIR